MMCDEMNNVDVHNVTNVIGLDKRISPHFFNSGTPYGGTCFPRDAMAFIKFAKDRDMEAKNLIFAEEVNQKLQKYIFEKCK
jgi:UDPglucose 6-dehydrogenase